MTGKEWSDYFQTLEQEQRDALENALETLHNDPMFQQVYGIQFVELVALIHWPLKAESLA